MPVKSGKDGARPPRIIVVTGVPGTGKTTLSALLAEKLGARLIKVNEIVREERLFSSYADDGAMIADMRRLKSRLVMLLKENGEGRVVIEGHLLCDMRIDGAVAIVLREHLRVLRKRLSARGYAPGKIRDNLLSEAIDYCGESAGRNYRNSFEIMSGRDALKKAIAIANGMPQKNAGIDLIGELEEMMKNSKDRRFVI